MSPFLYLLVVEAMSRKLQLLQGSGELRGLKIARGVKAINHAQFVDDTILLGGASITIARRFNSVLSTFLKAIDGKINLAKSKVYGWNCTLGMLAKIARTRVLTGIAI